MTIDSIGTSTPAQPAVKTAADGSAAARSGGTASASGATGSAATSAATAASGTSAASKSGDAAAADPSLEQVKQAVSQVNKALADNNQGIEFSIDQDSKRTVVKVIDQTTKEVLRQFPTQQALDIAKSLEKKSGMLLQDSA